MQLRLRPSFTFAALTLAFACGDDPVSYSEPVGIELKAESGKVVNGTLSEEKSITTESGNPFGAFVANAREALGGADPSSIDVESATILLGATSDGVASLGEVFDGTVDVLFQMNDTNDSFPVGSIAIDGSTGSGPESVEIAFEPESISADNYDKLLGGSFKIVYRGPTHADFASANAKADLQLTLSFVAFE